eukprot:scaffold311044_cov51-Attheya_sp.AAC.1
MHWDLVCKNPHDRKNSQSVEWHKTSWTNPMGTLTDADRSLLDISLETEPVTTVGANAGWFLLRGYSIGSSTVDGFVGILNQCSTATKEPEENASLFNVARPILHYITRNLNETVQEEWDGDDDGNDGGGNKSRRILLTQTMMQQRKFLRLWLVLLKLSMKKIILIAIYAAMQNTATDSPEYVRLMVKKVENAPTDDPFIVILLKHIELPDEMHDEVLKTYVKAMGGKEPKTRKANIKKAQAWLNAPPFERPVVFDGLTKLRGKCATKFRKPTKEYQNLLRPELIKFMLEELPEGGPDEQESLDQKLLQQILVSTFMTKLTGKRKEFTK